MGETNYAPIRFSMWEGQTAKACKGDPIALWLMGFLPSHFAGHSSGVFRFQLDIVAFRSGIDEREILASLAKLTESGFCDYDRATDWVFVTRMAEIRHPDGLKPRDNVVVNLRRQVNACPCARIREKFAAKYGATHTHTSTPSKPLPETATPFEAPSKPLPETATPFEAPSKPLPEIATPFEAPSKGTPEMGTPLRSPFEGYPRNGHPPSKPLRRPFEETETETETETVGGSHVHAREADTHPPSHPLAGMKTRPEPDPRRQADWDALSLEARAQCIHRVDTGDPPFVARYKPVAEAADIVAVEYVEAVRDEGGTIDESGAFDRLRRAAVFLVDRCQIPPGRVEAELRRVLEWARRDQGWRKSGKPGRDLFVSPVAVWGDREGATIGAGVPMGVETKLPRNLEAARAWEASRPSQATRPAVRPAPPPEHEPEETPQSLRAKADELEAKSHNPALQPYFVNKLRTVAADLRTQAAAMESASAVAV